MDNNFSKSSNEWSDVCLDKFIKVKHGYAFKGKYITTEETPHILVTPGNFHIGGGFKSNKFKYYTDDYPEEYILKNGDIVVTMTDLSKESDTLGYSAKIPNSLNGKKYLHNQRIGLVEFKNEDIEPDFAYWLMRTRDYQGFIVGSASGTSIMHTSPTRICEYEFKLPPLPEQKAIAEVLSSLDDKIDLLHRQNETLEQMAQTLFRQWFVEEADDSWEYIKLSAIAEVKNGFAFRSKSYVDYIPECLEVFKMGHIERGGGLRQNPKKDFVPREERLKRYILNKNDIVMAMTDMKDNVVILGVPAMIDKDNHYVLNQRVARIYLKSNDELISQYLLYTQLNEKENIAILQSKANSGVQVNLSTQTIKDIEVSIPPMRLQKEKGQTIIDLYEKKNINMFQIKTLEKLRDTLLPKLMSGELRVNL
ncbi:restriction endonuclease subunit S [Aequorivita sinensis]|uniref:restriction endonuclease subunit S n=1 Tax=Aequorivita sinensis TaxID=1382458 RepID=UPI0023019465|nr:restriction endonuclease subunit S [Aequorivita sinensis]